MGILANAASSLIERWDLDRVQLAALRKVQRRAGLGVAATAPAGGQSRWRWRWRAAARFYSKLVLFAVLGLTGVAGVLFPSFFFGFAFSYTLIMLIVGLTLLDYFVALLLDTSENRILFHLPISGRTLLAVRILGVAKYAGLLALSVSLPTAVAVAIRFGGVALLLFASSLVLTLVLVVAATLAVCLLALRYVKPALIRQGILLFQTASFLCVFFAASAVIDAEVPLAARVADVPREPWWFFYPPGWMAGLLEFLLIEKTRFNGALAAIAVLAPLGGFIGCMRLFSGRRFTALLSRLEAVARGHAPKQEGGRRRRIRLSERLSAAMNGDRQERAVFGLTSKLMKRDLALNLGTYTYIGAMLVNIGSFAARHHDHAIQDLPLALRFAFYTSCYMPLLLAIKAPGRLQYSAEWRAAWCYRILPFSRPGIIVSGTMKAYLARYIVPAYLALLVVSAGVWGASLALDVLFAAAAVALVCVLGFSRTAAVIPRASEVVSGMPQDDRGRSALAFIPLSAGLIATHVVLNAVAGAWGVAAGIVMVGAAIVVAYRKLRSMSSLDFAAPDRHVGWHRPPASQMPADASIGATSHSSLESRDR